MDIYKQSTRNGQTEYTQFKGVDSDSINAQMEAIGHTDIQDISEAEYLSHKKTF